MLLFVALLIGVIIHTITFINTEHHIYFWDYNGYWRMWENFSQQLTANPRTFLSALVSSIYNEDYNALPVALITPFYYFGAASRLTYILSLQLVYFIPVVLLFYKAAQCCVVKRSSAVNAIIIMMAGSYVAFWAPTLKGYPDISGLIGILLAIILIVKTPLTGKIDWKMALLAGICLWSAFLFRRWYAFTVVSLYLTLPILNYVLYARAGSRRVNVQNILINFFISGISSVVLALIFQKNLIKRVLTTDYSVIYSAYRSDISSSFYNTLHDIGIYLLPFFLIGFVASLFDKETKSRAFILFCVANLLISFYLFTKTQSPGVQHCLPFAMWALFVAIYGVYKIYENLTYTPLKVLFTVVVIAGSLAVNIISTVPRFKNELTENKLLPTRSYPLHIDNYDNYVQLIKKMESLVKEKNDRIAVFSSSDVLNDDMIKTLAGGGLDQSIEYTSQVDLRDGIRLEPLKARYVVVVDPVQTHISPSGQQVITIPAHSILNGENIGRAYKRVGASYALSGQATAYIYEKVRNFTPEEYSDFISLFAKSYPDWVHNYKSGLSAAFMSASVSKGDVWGEFNIDGNGTIFAHPGENRPTTVEWVVNDVPTLSVSSVSTSCPDEDGVNIILKSDGVDELSTIIPPGETRQINMQPFNGKRSTLIIDKRQSVACDSVTIQKQ